MTVLTIPERLAHAETAFREGRIIQHSWRREGDNGREMVCALAAFGPDINAASDCPADLMPQWLAELVPMLDDGIASADVPWFMDSLLTRAKAWSILDGAAWDRVRTGLMVGMVRDALAAALPVMPAEKPAYWGDVEQACQRVIAALEGGDANQLEEARAAAWAAEAAARAAAWAAEAAARAAARAAEAAAYRSVAELLFKLIDAELGAVVG